MPDTRDARPVVDGAERAAAAGDYASAEQLLREAALLLEASLGSLHPELANTLNNLGVVCEITNKPADAEQFFRRASTIAAAALEPDHPFVATSRKNLEDFCRARGIAVDPPAPTRAVAAEEDAPAAPSGAVPSEPPVREGSQPVASRKASRPVAFVVMVVVAFLAAFVGFLIWFRSSEVAEPTATIVEPATGDPAPAPPTTPGGPEIDEPAATAPTPPERPMTGTTASARPSIVAAALLCRSLITGSRDWQCVAPDIPVGPGRLIFYTRIRSATDTTVQHRAIQDSKRRMYR